MSDSATPVRELNAELTAIANEGRFATALVLTYFAPTDHLSLVNAGRPPLSFTFEMQHSPPKNILLVQQPPNKGLQRTAYRGANQPLWHHEATSRVQQPAVTSAAAEPLVR